MSQPLPTPMGREPVRPRRPTPPDPSPPRRVSNLVLRLARNAVNPLFEERFRAVRRRLRPPHALLAPAARALDDAIAGRDPAAADAAVRSLLRLNRTRILDTLAKLHDTRATETPTA